ncbi:Serine/threonine-protein kinase greatwall [Bienertia sinuspersici]
MYNRKKIHNFVGDYDYDHDRDREDETSDGDRKLGLLKALRLSQTRAREAEAKYRAITKERDALAMAFVQDSMQILAYRQFVRLLEVQVSLFQKQQKVCCDCGKRKQEEDEVDDGNGSNGLNFFMTVAFCLGIAGVGLAIGCKYLYS